MALSELLQRPPNYEQRGLAFRNYKLPSDTNTETIISVIPSLQLGDKLVNIGLRGSLPRNLVKDSWLYPLHKIVLVDTPPGSKVQINPTKNQVSRYTGSTGELTIYLGNLWKISTDFVSGNFKDNKKIKWGTDYILSVLPEIQSASAGLQDEQKTYVIWQHLIDSIITDQAALTHLTTNEALYKKIIADHWAVHDFIILVAAGLIGAGIEVGNIAHNLVDDIGAGIIFGDLISNPIVGRRVTSKKNDLQKKLLIAIGKEPLVKIF